MKILNIQQPIGFVVSLLQCRPFSFIKLPKATAENLKLLQFLKPASSDGRVKNKIDKNGNSFLIPKGCYYCRPIEKTR